MILSRQEIRFTPSVSDMPDIADILENDIFRASPELLTTLLKDHTTSRDDAVCNIFWATSDYEHLGKGYGYRDPILPELITDDNGQVIMPRVLKHKDTQSERVRDMAEVFTPSWVCNAQNNLIDEAWFGRKDVFNTEYTSEDGVHGWKTNPDKTIFPEGKTWKDYVRDIRLEITCGEAPYIVSRYDTTTGTVIPLADRIGLLSLQEYLRLRMAGRQPAYSPRVHACLLCRILPCQVRQRPFGEIHQLHRLHHLMERVADGRAERCRA